MGDGVDANELKAIASSSKMGLLTYVFACLSVSLIVIYVIVLCIQGQHFIFNGAWLLVFIICFYCFFLMFDFVVLFLLLSVSLTVYRSVFY